MTSSQRGNVNTSPLGLAIAWLAITFLLLFVSIKISSVFSLPVLETLPLVVLGLGLVAIGFAFRYLALKGLLTSNRSVQWSHVPGTLVEDGPFRYSRNPAYLGILLMVVGALLTEVDLPMIVVLIVMFAVLNRQVSREEALLIKQFGEPFLSYRKKTRRWL